MKDTNKLHLIALTKVDRMGPVTGRKLVEHFGDAHQIFRTKPSLLRKIPKIGEKLAAGIHDAKLLRSAEAELSFAERHGINVRSIFDIDYPGMLKNIHDAPLVLYQKGKLRFDEGLNIAIVGTRNPSAYGRATSERIARYLSDRGVNVVSGLAYGIDGEAHKAVLKAGGKTTAVLGHGLSTIYPRDHAREAEAIGIQGALITEFHSEVGPDSRNFPLRNRIISGLCHGTIVVEAANRGGALITAKMAFEQDREVYAVPGDLTRKTSIGCNQLIRKQFAKIFTHPQDIIDDLSPMLGKSPHGNAVVGRGEEFKVKLGPEEKKVATFLREKTRMIGDLASLTGNKFSELQRTLLGMEVKGVVKQIAGGAYSIC